jgi:hypothetical protein
MDKDGSGSISKTEVMVALQRVNVFLTTEETCLLMDTLAGDTHPTALTSYKMGW